MDPQSDLRRLKARCAFAGGHWFWRGAKSSSGHGNFRVAGYNTTANRASWELCGNELRDGVPIHSACDQGYRCIRPSHWKDSDGRRGRDA